MLNLNATIIVPPTHRLKQTYRLKRISDVFDKIFLKTYVFPSLCVLGRKYVLSATQSQFRPSRLATTLRKVQNIYTQEHQLYFYYYHFGAH